MITRSPVQVSINLQLIALLLFINSAWATPVIVSHSNCVYYSSVPVFTSRFTNNFVTRWKYNVCRVSKIGVIVGSIVGGKPFNQIFLLDIVTNEQHQDLPY